MNFMYSDPLSSSIATILVTVVILILLPLVLNGKFILALLLLAACSFLYLAISYLFEKLCETLPDRTTSKTQFYLDVATRKITEQINSKDTSDDLQKVQRKVEEMDEKLDSLNNVLIQYLLPELGICVEEDEEGSAWVQCDTLARDVPFHIFSNKVACRFMTENIQTFADLVSCQEKDLLNLPDLGTLTIERIKQLLAVVGLRLEMTVKEEDGIWYYLREKEETQPLTASDTLIPMDEMPADETN